MGSKDRLKVNRLKVFRILQPSVFGLNTCRYVVELGLSSAGQLEDVMYLVTQSFEKNMDNGGQ